MTTGGGYLQMSDSKNIAGERKVLTSSDEVRDAAAAIAASAKRSLAIFTHDLEPQVYDQDAFLEPIKHLVLGKSFARVRVLLVDPGRAIKDGNRFVNMARRLSSYIEFRNVREDYRDNPAAFCIADDVALMYRLQASRWDGIVDMQAPTIARKYLNFFDEIWHASEVEPEIRELRI